MSQFRLLICGSRGWKDPEPIRRRILEYSAGHDLVVIHGANPKGADALADQICTELAIPVIREPADWDQYGRAAGPIRNQKMLSEHKPDLVYAFRASGKSNGTDDMVRRAESAHVPTIVEYEDEQERVTRV